MLRFAHRHSASTGRNIDATDRTGPLGAVTPAAADRFIGTNDWPLGRLGESETSICERLNRKAGAKPTANTRWASVVRVSAEETFLDRKVRTTIVLTSPFAPSEPSGRSRLIHHANSWRKRRLVPSRTPDSSMETDVETNRTMISDDDPPE